MKWLLFSVVFGALFSYQVSATEYIYRDLMANTLDSPSCAKETEAMQFASKSATIERYSKRFCQSQGYGWHVAEIKETGKMICHDCGTNTSAKRCHLEDVVVSCKRIKPGSVGMLPGKS